MTTTKKKVKPAPKVEPVFGRTRQPRAPIDRRMAIEDLPNYLTREELAESGPWPIERL